MEECEVLCTKIGILNKGQFQCFGSVQHLKNKYGQGYTLILKCRKKANDEMSYILNVNKVKAFVAENIPESTLLEIQIQTLFFQIGLKNDASFSNIAYIFNLIEENKYSLDLETYSLSQTTLEQVFLSFAKQKH